MSDANEKKITPINWLDDSRWKFTVPIYQRLFTWEEEQFDRLLADLKEWNKTGPYYLGIITVVQKGDQYVLIDGQQRLTVIAILAGMFGWCKGKSPEEYLNYEARSADREALKKIWENGSKWLDKNEHELNRILAEAGIASESMRKLICHIVKYKEYWNKARGGQNGLTMRDHDGSKQDSLKEKLTLLVSVLPEEYSSQINLQNEYFEKMNSAGKQLEPHEILKVRLCKRPGQFAIWNAVEDFTKPYDENSNDGKNECCIELQDIVTLQETGGEIVINKESETEKKVSISIRQADGNGHPKTSIEKWRPSLIDFPMFLLHVLKIVNVSDEFTVPSDSHNLLRFFDKSKLDTEKFCDTMSRYRLFLDNWVIHREVADDEDDNDSKYSFWVRDTEGERKELQYLKKPEEMLVVKKIKQLQLILFALGGQNQEWLYEAYKAYNADASKNVVKDLMPWSDLGGWYEWLRNKVIKSAGFEVDSNDNGEWNDGYLTYGNVRPAHFMCLDYFLWELANLSEDAGSDNKELQERVFGEKIPEAVKNFIPRAHRSVEHFHPQTDDYSRHRGVTADNDEKKQGWGGSIEKEQTSIKNIFGNLALISAGRNSEYSNYSVAEKSERIDKRVKERRLESIKLYLMKESCHGNEVDWLPDTAREHAKLMLEVIKWGLGQNEGSTTGIQ